MAVQSLLSTHQADYGSCSYSDAYGGVNHLTHTLSKASNRELAMFIGKVAVVALVIAGLVTACIFTGGLAAAGIGAGYGLIKLFGLVAISYACGSTAGVLAAALFYQIFNKVRGVDREETDQNTKAFLRKAGVCVLGSSLILSIVGAPLLIVGFPIYKTITASKPPQTYDIYSMRAAAEAGQTAKVDASVSIEQLQLDRLLSKVRLADTSQLRNELDKCFETFRNRVFYYVWNLSGAPDAKDPQWGEHHLFDNREILDSAIRNAFRDHPHLFS